MTSEICAARMRVRSRASSRGLNLAAALLKARAARTPGITDPATAVCTKKKVQTKVVAATSPAKRRRPRARWVTASFARPPVDSPSYPPLTDLLGSQPASWQTHAGSRQGRPCDARQARRNLATSAAARKVRYASLRSHRSRSATKATRAHAPLVDQDARIIGAPRRAGISFFEDSGKALRGNEKTLRRKSLYPRFAAVAVPAVITGPHRPAR
jgi:hypothetical protein